MFRVVNVLGGRHSHSHCMYKYKFYVYKNISIFIMGKGIRITRQRERDWERHGEIEKESKRVCTKNKARLSCFKQTNEYDFYHRNSIHVLYM